MTVDALLHLLKGVRQTRPNEWMACCPAHDDSSPSLHVTDCPDGRLLIHCFAGCSSGEVLNALGLEFRDLMPEAAGERLGPVRRPFDFKRVREHISREVAVVLVIAEDIASGTVVTEDLRERLAVAAERLSNTLQYLDGP